MTDRVTLVVCIVTSGGGFGVIGVAFGALASRSAWQHGHPGGGWIGRYFLNALNRVRERDVSEPTAAILHGAIDGGVFLAVVGSVLGAWAAFHLDDPATWLLAAWAVLALLAATAAGLGLVGYSLVRTPDVPGLGILCASSLVGAVVGSCFNSEDAILLGSAVGALFGFLAANLLRRPTPPSDEPKTTHEGDDP